MKNHYVYEKWAIEGDHLHTIAVPSNIPPEKGYKLVGIFSANSKREAIYFARYLQQTPTENTTS